MQRIRKAPIRRVAVVLTVAAFGLVPLPTQAAPHYYLNGAKVKEGVASTKTYVAWGTLKIEGNRGGVPGNHVTCHYASAGTLFNPTGGGAGEGLTQASAAFDCEQELVCPSEAPRAGVTSANTPWHNLLTEEVAGTIRQETTGVKVFIECFNGKEEVAKVAFVVGAAEKGERPNEKAGSSALHPGFLEYDTPGSGQLEVEGTAGSITAKTEGLMKILGYNAQEPIGVANP